MTEPHSDPGRNGNRSPCGGLHPVLYLVTALAVLWSIIIVGASFFALAPNDLPLGVIAYFAVVAFGVPALMWRVCPPHGRKTERRRFRDWIRQSMDIHTGPIGGKQAAVQVLLIPGATAVAFTIFAVIDIVEHSVH